MEMEGGTNNNDVSYRRWRCLVDLSSGKVSLSSFHLPPPSLIILSTSYRSRHPSLWLIVISLCASRQASPLRTYSGRLLGDGPLINGGASRDVRVCLCTRACVSFLAVITN